MCDSTPTQTPLFDPSSIPATVAEVLHGIGPAVVQKMASLAVNSGDARAATFVMKMLEKAEGDGNASEELERLQKRLSTFDKTVVAEVVSLLAEADARRAGALCGLEPGDG